MDLVPKVLTLLYIGRRGRVTETDCVPSLLQLIDSSYHLDTPALVCLDLHVSRPLSDTIKRGTLSKNRKDCLKPRKYQSQRTITGSRPILRLAQSPRRDYSPPRRGPLVQRPRSTRPRTGYRFSDSPEAPRVKPRTKYRFSDLLEAGSTTNSSPLPRPTSLTKHHVSNHSRDVSRTWAQYSRVADGT